MSNAAMSRPRQDVLLWFYRNVDGVLISAWMKVPELDSKLHIIEALVKDGLLYRRMPNPNFYYQLPDPNHPEEFGRFCITEAGEETAMQILDAREDIARQEAEKRANKEAEDKRKRAEAKQAVWHFFLGPLVGALTALFVQNFGTIWAAVVAFVRSLFQR